MYKTLLRPMLFSFDPEKVHYFTFSLIKLAHLLALEGYLEVSTKLNTLH